MFRVWKCDAVALLRVKRLSHACKNLAAGLFPCELQCKDRYIIETDKKMHAIFAQRHLHKPQSARQKAKNWWKISVIAKQLLILHAITKNRCLPTPAFSSIITL